MLYNYNAGGLGGYNTSNFEWFLILSLYICVIIFSF
jgi:hypothetical protein